MECNVPHLCQFTYSGLYMEYLNGTLGEYKVISLTNKQVKI